MEKSIITTGKTIDAAVEAALAQLGLTRDDVTYQVLAMPKSGFLGIGAVPAKVQVTYEAPNPKPEAPKVALSSASRSKPKAKPAAPKQEVKPEPPKPQPKAEAPKAEPKPEKPKAEPKPKQEKPKAEKVEKAPRRPRPPRLMPLPRKAPWSRRSRSSSRVCWRTWAPPLFPTHGRKTRILTGSI